MLSTTQSILQRRTAAYSVSNILLPRKQNNSHLWAILISTRIVGNAVFYKRNWQHHNTLLFQTAASDTKRYATLSRQIFYCDFILHNECGGDNSLTRLLVLPGTEIIIFFEQFLPTLFGTLLQKQLLSEIILFEYFIESHRDLHL